MQIRHFFWDFDGTLFDTYPRIARAAKKALAASGIADDDARLLARLKVTLPAAFKLYAAESGVPLETLAKAYTAHAEEEGMASLTLYPGAEDFLRAVVAHGGRNYLYTHRDLLAVEALKARGVYDLFTDFVTREDGFPSKPAPDALEHLIKKHGLDKRECMMFGDRDIDLDAAKNAGIQTALFDPDGFYGAYDTPIRVRDYETLRRLLIEN